MAYLTAEEREERNRTYRKYGYYWSKPRNTNSWVLFDRRGVPVKNPDVLWIDIKENTGKYDQERIQFREKAIRLAGSFIAQEALVLDCETTGAYGAYEEIIELAILDTSGNILFQSLIRCEAAIHPEATEKHGITNEHLKDAPIFPEVWSRVAPIIRGREVVMFNADFDRRLIVEECAHYKLTVPSYRPHDLMRMYMAIVPEGRYRLQEACVHFGIAVPGHRGADDAESTRQLLLKMAEVEI